jgi:hypothetical protein
VGFGENRIGSLIRQHPEKKAEVEQLQKEMTYYMLATFADRFRDPGAMAERERAQELMAKEGIKGDEGAEYHGVNVAQASPEELEEVLSSTVLGEFKKRLDRVGIEYQSPDRP